MKTLAENTLFVKVVNKPLKKLLYIQETEAKENDRHFKLSDVAGEHVIVHFAYMEGLNKNNGILQIHIPEGSSDDEAKDHILTYIKDWMRH